MSTPRALYLYTSGMPMRYIVDAGQRCIFIHLSGVVTSWEIGTNAQRVWGDERFEPFYSRLVDCSDVLELPDSPVIQAIGEDSSSDRVLRMAAIIPEKLRNVLHANRNHLKSFEIETFRSPADAAEWLGVSLPVPWPPEVNAGE